MLFRDVVMAAPDPRAQRDFYGNALGLPIDEDSAERVALRAGATRIVFQAGDEAATYHFAFRVGEQHFAAAKRWLAARAELVEEEGRDEFEWDFWGARAAYSHDPAGNAIEVIAYAGLEPSGTGEFGPQAVIGLAELGFPVADPAAVAARLGETFGIGLWDRDEVTPDALTPVGERGATFLLSPLGRTWLFGDAAVDHPLDVVLGGVPAGVLELDEHRYRVQGRV